ncbi:MAG: class I SAM-dependent methyltransferase [Chitinophagaceae bacterium]|nr:class I SAM-dependent methyltransferase [Chitinophagaceae bacterium]
MASEYRHRIEGIHSSLLDPYYLVYYFLNHDLKEVIAKYAKGKVLDVGCGNKPYKNQFPDSITEYVGCDIEQSNLRVVDKICPATDLDFDDNSFDTVFCTQVLEHVYDHRTAFKEISRVLRPGGYFIGSLPMAWPHHEEPTDFFRFTKYGLEGLIKEYGLEVELIKANGGKWAFLGQMIIINFSEKPGENKSLSRLKTLVFKILLCKVWINLIFRKLDKISSQPEYHNTLNFVFVARKPE